MRSEFNDTTEHTLDLTRIDNEACCAYRIYPEPTGTNYYCKDLRTRNQVEQLFDYCQIMEGVIYEAGWEFLIKSYGYATLFEINQVSGWFDCANVEEFQEYVSAYREDIKGSI